LCHVGEGRRSRLVQEDDGRELSSEEERVPDDGLAITSTVGRAAAIVRWRIYREAAERLDVVVAGE
jgi:hypothetical protein